MTTGYKNDPKHVESFTHLGRVITTGYKNDPKHVESFKTEENTSRHWSTQKYIRPEWPLQ